MLLQEHTAVDTVIICIYNLFIKHISVLLHIFTESAYYILKNYILKNTIPTNFYIYVKDYLYQEQHIVLET
jgi:hypothetical protein